MEPLKDLLISHQSNIPIFGFIVNFLYTAFFSWGISWLYGKYGTSLSNRETLAKTLILISTTTMLIITVVKSSLALSLGLVGALSIIRFRTAVKEPEELAFIFLAIAIGLGFGANQTYVTIIAFLLSAMLIIFLYYIFGYRRSDKNMFLTLACNNNQDLKVNTFFNILDQQCSFVKLHRYDTSIDNFEAVFIIVLNNNESLIQIENQISKQNKDIKITFWNQDI